MAEVMCTKFEIKQTVPETGRYQLMINGVFQDGYTQSKGSLTSTSLSNGELKITNGTGTGADEYWACFGALRTMINNHLPGYDVYVVEVDYRTASKFLSIFLKSSASAIATANLHSGKGLSASTEGTTRMLVPTGVSCYVGTGSGDACTTYIKNITIVGYRNLNADLTNLF